VALKFFRIPVEGGKLLEAELNAFLAGHKVVRLARELVEREQAPAWAICVDYLEGGNVVASPAGSRGKGGSSKVDYREVLSVEDFAVFAKLREHRKLLSEKEGVPVYAVFTNEQLAEIAKARPSSRAALCEIAGVGAAKVEKFADTVLGVIAENPKQVEPPSDATP
jgi:superfamily II DNA helicase RecQ